MIHQTIRPAGPACGVMHMAYQCINLVTQCRTSVTSARPYDSVTDERLAPLVELPRDLYPEGLVMMPGWYGTPTEGESVTRTTIFSDPTEGT